MSQISDNRRRRAIRRGLTLTGLIILLAAAAAMIFFNREKPPQIRSAVLQNGDLTSAMYLTARIEPGAIQQSYVGRQMVSVVHVRPGDQVKKGDPLITFDLKDYEDRLAEAEELRQEAEDAVAEMEQASQQQSDDSDKALRDLQRQISRLSASLGGSIDAVVGLGRVQALDIELNEEQIEALTSQLLAIDPDAADAAGQIRQVLTGFASAVSIQTAESFQNQLDVLQSSLQGTNSSLTGLLGSLASQDLLGSLDISSLLGGQASLGYSAQSILAQAVQAEEQARKALEEAIPVLVAEFDGVVAEVNAKAGQFTAAQGSDSLTSSLAGSLGSSFAGSLTSLPENKTKVLVLYDNTRPIATYLASRYDASRLAAGMPVVYRQDGLTYHGKITYKSKFAANTSFGSSQSSGSGSLFGDMGSVGGISSEPSLRIEMSIAGDNLTDLVLGFNIDAEIQTASAEDVLLLPAEAMRRELGQYYVFVVSDEGVLSRRNVTPGIQSDTHVQVIDGLSAGMRVVLGPANNLADGMFVTERSDP